LPARLAGLAELISHAIDAAAITPADTLSAAIIAFHTTVIRQPERHRGVMRVLDISAA